MDSYVNDRGKRYVIYECPTGHRMDRRVKDSLPFCRICEYEFRIVTLVTDANYSLLSFDKHKKIIDIKCPNGHKYQSSIVNFRAGHRCALCAVKVISEERLTNILSSAQCKIEKAPERITTKSAIKVRCNNNHVYTTKVNYIQQGYGCPHCSNQAKKQRKTPLDEMCVENSRFTAAAVKRRVLQEKVFEEKCTACGTGRLWNKKPLMFVLDHINGINTDHRLKNLRLLCPNCNSQTETFAGRKHIKHDWKCLDCGTEISRRSKRCTTCSNRRRRPASRKIVWPEKYDLQRMVNELGYRGTAAKLGVSDSAVGRMLRKVS